MSRTIVVGVDSSDCARSALSAAAGFARSSDDTTIHVIAVVDQSSHPMTFGIEEVDDLNHAAETLVSQLSDEMSNNGIEITGTVRRGTVYAEILNYAHEMDADIIYVGQHGTTGLERGLIGSTVDRLIRISDIPVTVVPMD